MRSDGSHFLLHVLSDGGVFVLEALDLVEDIVHLVLKASERIPLPGVIAYHVEKVVQLAEGVELRVVDMIINLGILILILDLSV